MVNDPFDALGDAFATPVVGDFRTSQTLISEDCDSEILVFPQIGRQPGVPSQ
jgi:hypothetical protein